MVEITMLSIWESLTAVETFAANEVDRAKYYDFDAEYLIDFREHAEHYEMFGAGLGETQPK